MAKKGTRTTTTYKSQSGAACGNAHGRTPKGGRGARWQPQSNLSFVGIRPQSLCNQSRCCPQSPLCSVSHQSQHQQAQVTGRSALSRSVKSGPRTDVVCGACVRPRTKHTHGKRAHTYACTETHTDKDTQGQQLLATTHSGPSPASWKRVGDKRGGCHCGLQHIEAASCAQHCCLACNIPAARFLMPAVPSSTVVLPCLMHRGQHAPLGAGVSVPQHAAAHHCQIYCWWAVCTHNTRHVRAELTVSVSALPPDLCHIQRCRQSVMF